MLDILNCMYLSMQATDESIVQQLGELEDEVSEEVQGKVQKCDQIQHNDFTYTVKLRWFPHHRLVSRICLLERHIILHLYGG